MKTCSITLDIIQITPSTTFYPNKLNVAIVHGLGLITLDFLVSMMTEILFVGCFLRHIIQSNLQSRRKDPPHTPVGGASRMLRGLMLRRRAVLGTPKCEKSVGRRGSGLGKLTALPQTPSWWRGALCCPLLKNPTYNIVIVLVLCVCTHVYENTLLVLLNVKHGASQLYWGGRGPPTV